MPIFEYVCEDCGTSFEKLVRASGANGVACPSCGQQHLKQQFSTFAAHANGAPAKDVMPSCPGGMCRTPDLCGRN
jgi:putative FmdB family regulatory protein